MWVLRNPTMWELRFATVGFVAFGIGALEFAGRIDDCSGDRLFRVSKLRGGLGGDSETVAKFIGGVAGCNSSCQSSVVSQFSFIELPDP